MDKKKKRKDKINRQMEIVNQAKTEKRELTPEEQAELNSLQREIDELTAQIKAEERQAEGGVQQEDAVQAERQRALEITSLCREFGLEAERYITGGHSVEQVQAAVIEQMRSQNQPIATQGSGDIRVEKAEEDKFREAATDSIILRSGLTLERPAEGAREMMGMSLRDLAIECLTLEGKTGLNRRSSDELFEMVVRQFFNPTAAFPAILDNAVNKAYVEGHKTAAVTFDQWTKKGSLKDFKVNDNNYLAGPAGEFLEVPEGGELKHDAFGDEKRPTRRLKTYGRQFTLTRQAFINDDIDLITQLPAKYAAGARKTINKQAYGILVNNPAIYDGTVLFSQAHGNLVKTGTGTTRESMQAMITALQTQVDEFEEACIIRPAVIVVPIGMSFDIYTLFNSPMVHTSDNTQAVNPLYRYANTIQVVEDPTINVLCKGFGNIMPWFLIGSKDDTAFIEVDYLNGQEIPNIRRMEKAGTLGFVWDIYLDWGISVMDWRGAIKNPGITIKNPLE